MNQSLITIKEIVFREEGMRVVVIVDDGKPEGPQEVALKIGDTLETRLVEEVEDERPTKSGS